MGVVHCRFPYLHSSTVEYVGRARRVPQILLPILFNICKYVMRRILNGWHGRFSVGRMRMSNLRYPDDRGVDQAPGRTCEDEQTVW